MMPINRLFATNAAIFKIGETPYKQMSPY